MNKYIIIILLSIVGTSIGQYGIPDDDDDIFVSHELTLRTGKSLPIVFRDDTSYPRMEPTFQASYGPVVSVAPSYTSLDNQGYQNSPKIGIVKYEMSSDHSGNYNVETISGDGSSQRSQGTMKRLKDSNAHVSVMSGSYSFLGDDGKTYAVDWKADEMGFRASGAHLP